MATSIDKTDELSKFLKDMFNVYRGALDDVLSRYTEIAKIMPKYIVRITGDCPFIDLL